MSKKNTDPNKEYSWFRKFLLYLSATDTDVIKRCPKKDLIIQEIKGIAILITSIFAFFSGTFAIQSVSENIIISILVGIVWGIAVMNIDRLLVSSFGAPDSAPVGKRILDNFIKPFFIRLPLALILGLIISIPLELKIFDPEINYFNTQTLNEAISILDESAKKEKKEIEEKYTKSVDNEYNTQKQELIKEQKDLREALKNEGFTTVKQAAKDANGNLLIDTSGNVTYIEIQVSKKETRYAEKRLKDIQKEIDDLKERRLKGLALTREKILSEVKEVDVKYQRLRKARIDSPRTSLGARYKALETIKENDRSIYEMTIWVRVLIVLIEIMPVLIKILSKRTPYEVMLDSQDRKISNEYEDGRIR